MRCPAPPCSRRPHLHHRAALPGQHRQRGCAGGTAWPCRAPPLGAFQAAGGGSRGGQGRASSTRGKRLAQFPRCGLRPCPPCPCPPLPCPTRRDVRAPERAGQQLPDRDGGWAGRAWGGRPRGCAGLGWLPRAQRCSPGASPAWPTLPLLTVACTWHLGRYRSPPAAPEPAPAGRHRLHQAPAEGGARVPALPAVSCAPAKRCGIACLAASVAGPATQPPLARAATLMNAVVLCVCPLYTTSPCQCPLLSYPIATGRAHCAPALCPSSRSPPRGRSILALNVMRSNKCSVFDKCAQNCCSGRAGRRALTWRGSRPGRGSRPPAWGWRTAAWRPRCAGGVVRQGGAVARNWCTVAVGGLGGQADVRAQQQCQQRRHAPPHMLPGKRPAN